MRTNDTTGDNYQKVDVQGVSFVARSGDGHLQGADRQHEEEWLPLVEALEEQKNRVRAK